MSEVPLSDSDCSEIVQKKISNRSFQIHKTTFKGPYYGFPSDRYFLEVKIKKNDKTEEKHKFFVKTLSKKTMKRNLGSQLKVIFKETQFFEKYLAMLKDNSINVLDSLVPVLYFANSECLVFEDLTESGYQTLANRKPLNTESIKAALISLAKLHASCLILEEKKSIRLIEQLEDELEESFYCSKDLPNLILENAKRGAEALMDLNKNHNTVDISSDSFRDKVLQGVDLQKYFTAPSTKFRNTLCHGDFISQNCLFRQKKGISCKMIDFQYYRYCPPALDVLAFLYIATDKDFRGTFFQPMLQFYFSELTANLEKFGLRNVIDKEEFDESCAYFTRFGLTQALITLVNILIPEEDYRRLIQEEEAILMVRNKYNFVVEMCQKDACYRKFNFDILDELRQFYGSHS